MGIKPKKKICKGCGNEEYIFSKGKCLQCSKPSFKGLSSTSELKSTTPIKKYTKRAQKLKKEQSDIRKVYFDYHIERCTHSEGSGKPISQPTRANICHLFDKGRHPSLQANLDNYIYLTLDEHTLFDNYLFKNEFEKLEKDFPKSWEIACGRMKKLLPLCKERTKFYFNIKEYLDERNDIRPI